MTADGNAPIAVLLSGGVDSAVLVAELCKQHESVSPLYVRCGLYWEPTELEHARRFLDALTASNLAPLRVFELPLSDLYGDHWSFTGRDVPDHTTPDEAVYLPGRNLLLLAKPALWCHMNGVGAIALGPLKNNPFRDSTPDFFRACETALEEAVGGRLCILRPFAELSKQEVLVLGRDLPLELTFSCIRPVDGLHCGRCNKCAERQAAFKSAAISDATPYVR